MFSPFQDSRESERVTENSKCNVLCLHTHSMHLRQCLHRPRDGPTYLITLNFLVSLSYHRICPHFPQPTTISSPFVRFDLVRRAQWWGKGAHIDFSFALIRIWLGAKAIPALMALTGSNPVSIEGERVAQQPYYVSGLGRISNSGHMGAFSFYQQPKQHHRLVEDVGKWGEILKVSRMTHFLGGFVTFERFFFLRLFKF